MAEARAIAAADNARCGVPTCAGCKADHQAGNWGQENCREFRDTGVCQRQVFLTVTMARILAEVVIEMVRAGATRAEIQAVIGEIQAVDIVGLLEG